MAAIFLNNKLLKFILFLHSISALNPYPQKNARWAWLVEMSDKVLHCVLMKPKNGKWNFMRLTVVLSKCKFYKIKLQKQIYIYKTIEKKDKLLEMMKQIYKLRHV